MEKQLAEVVDGTEIKEITETQILCSCENDGASNMCSSENDHTGCRSVFVLCRGASMEFCGFRHCARQYACRWEQEGNFHKG